MIAALHKHGPQQLASTGRKDVVAKISYSGKRKSETKGNLTYWLHKHLPAYGTHKDIYKIDEHSRQQPKKISIADDLPNMR